MKVLVWIEEFRPTCHNATRKQLINGDLTNRIASSKHYSPFVHPVFPAETLYVAADNAIFYGSTGQDSIAQSMRLLDLAPGNTLVKPPRWTFYLANSKVSTDSNDESFRTKKTRTFGSTNFRKVYGVEFANRI